MQKKIPLIIGVVLMIASILLINVYMRQQGQAIEQKKEKEFQTRQANQTPVLVAKADIQSGAMINPDTLRVALVPNEYVVPRAVTSLDRIAGMMTSAPIANGEQLSLDKLTFPRQRAGGGLAELTPIGKRAITISVENTAALVGMLKPGDYVDLIALIPVPVQTAEGKQASQVMATSLFQNVIVLAVGQQLAPVVVSQGGDQQRYANVKSAEKTEPSPFITLALSPQEASLLSFVQEQSKIRLILRSPSDSQTQPVPPASWDSIFQYLMPKQDKQDKEEPKPQAVAEVEIYRGLNKEKIPLSQ